MSWKEHVLIYITSDDRTYGTIESPTHLLGHEIRFSNNPNKQYFLRLADVEIDNTVYQVNSTNNTFRITEQGGSTFSIVFDEGNYTITELITELETQLNANTTNSNTYSINYDEKTNKITLSFTGLSTDITISSISGGSPVNEVLGL